MVHTYTQNGLFIVMDIDSGSVHVVEKIVFDAVNSVTGTLDSKDYKFLLEKLGDRYPEKTLKEVFEALKELKEQELLFSTFDYNQFETKMTDSPIKAMCLHIAHDCNLRCSYCFASTGDFGTGRTIMEAETGKKAIDFLIERSGSRRNLEVDFFGGEPLMNFPAVKEIVAYARGLEKKHNKNFRFTITTNGVLLNDDTIDFINREMHNVVLSLDGRKEVNDLTRKTVGGGGSYDIIVPKFQELVSKRPKNRDYYVRGTFTRHNMDFSKDVFHLRELGFDSISVEPVVSDKSNPFAIQEEDLPRLFEEYENLAVRLLESKKKGDDFMFFHFKIDLQQGPCAIKRLRGCGCGNEYVAITPDGEIYPCHQFVGNDEWCMGNVHNKGELNLEMKEMFSKTSVLNKPDCTDCWAKFYCSGGCNANSAQYCGDIFKAHTLSCELEKKRVECAIAMQAAMSLQEA